MKNKSATSTKKLVSNEIAETKNQEVDKVADLDSGSNEQLTELKELTHNLMQTVQTMNIQSSSETELRDAINDVKAATRSMLVSPMPTQTNDMIESPRVIGQYKPDDCGCGPCACISEKCCTFKIELTSVRITAMQKEPVDMAINPFAEMELQIYPTIDGIGSVCPNLFSTYALRKPMNRPGIWYPINVKFATISVCKGTPKQVKGIIGGLEKDDGGLEATAARDEYGAADFNMTLDCCSSQPITTIVEVHLDNGGMGGGAFETMITATRECC